MQDAENRGDKENVRISAPKRDEEAEAERLGEKLAIAERKLNTQKKCTESLVRKVSRFPEQGGQAVMRALHKSKLCAQGSLFQIRTKSGRISTPARRIIRDSSYVTKSPQVK